MVTMIGAMGSTVPMALKMPPMTIHSAQAPQPKPAAAALMGPVMGPAPAMEEK